MALETFTQREFENNLNETPLLSKWRYPDRLKVYSEKVGTVYVERFRFTNKNIKIHGTKKSDGTHYRFKMKRTEENTVCAEFEY